MVAPLRIKAFALLALRVVVTRAFSPPVPFSRWRITQLATTSEPIFDFSREGTVESFERIDDAIMGGISTSALRDVAGEPYASWSGVCRIDGGGFCGMRTLPLQEPLQVGSDAEGFYIDCRLASDNEPERRVWKMTTRSRSSRGEELYQASFQLPGEGWTRVRVPFEDFCLVRGPRKVESGSPLNTTGGIYQIGLALSKFQISRNMTELENFRPGYFELQLEAIGLYSNSTDSIQVTEPNPLSLEESKRKLPLIVRIFLPVTKIFLSEKSNRRRYAMKILREQRGLSRPKAILFGIRKRSRSCGMVRSFLSLATIVLVDSFRTVARLVLRYGVFLPLRMATRILRLPAKILSQIKSKPETKATN